ncbi:ABC-three component system protein [Oerskovia enterophila]|uniref:ABC-three component system protein n=1 Tax=Oerskovia enterophila TaxID=43678 RepID=UPI003822D320
MLDYAAVKRLGGSNDRGVDIAGFLTESGWEGEWDCFQAKHYNKPITQAVAFPEIYKLFRHVLDGSYTLPRRYRFIAPQNCGKSLDRLLSSPTELRQEFIKHLEGLPKRSAPPPSDEIDQVGQFAETADFAIFDCLNRDELLTTHSTSRYHAYRFGTALAPRQQPEPAPDEVQPEEATYIQRLMDIYGESAKANGAEAIPTSLGPRDTQHLARQRISFYSAESLRMYARDNTPDGNFERLLDDVHDGVIETVHQPNQSGYERLHGVQKVALLLPLQNHLLATRVTNADRNGICHHLANQNRIHWVMAE